MRAHRPRLYRRYLLSSQSKYNQRHVASRVAGLDHDEAYGYLKHDKPTPSLAWEDVKPIRRQSGNAYVIVGDTVLDTSHAFAIDGVRRQCSGKYISEGYAFETLPVCILSSGMMPQKRLHCIYF
jgi:hypothetical protein